MKIVKKLSVFFFVMVILLLCSRIVYGGLAPDFTLTDIDGNTFALTDFRGKAVILDFFATWCGPCVAEIPHLRSLHEEFGEELIIISLSVSPSSDTVEKLLQFRQEHQIDWVVARDTIGINYDYDVQIVPTLVILDQEGYIQYRHVDFTDESVLREEIMEIIPEFGTWTSIMLVFLALTLAVVIYKRRKLKDPYPIKHACKRKKKVGLG